MSEHWDTFYGYAQKRSLNLPAEGRCIVISDIHGNLPFLKGLLEKVRFSPEDTLILLGDLVEKGKYSLQTVRYVMELEKTHQVYTLCGNCDAYILGFFETDAYDKSFFQDFLQRPMTKHSILRQMGRQAGLKDLRNLANLRKTIQKTHEDIWVWLKNLPHIYESQDYFFVHGGVSSMEDNPQLLAWDCMKNDYFYSQNHSFEKYMVVGHCPTTLYHQDIQNASPILDHQRKIISIDGGCVLKLDGQLNALLLEKGEITWDYYDGLPQIRALQSQNPSEAPLNIRWGHSNLQVLKKQGEFTLCKHLESGKEIQILSSFLKKRRTGYTCEDATDFCLSVQEGDVFSCSQQVTGGVLGKKDGITGWYWGEYEKE